MVADSRQRIALIAMQAYQIGQQLARDPVHAELLPHLQEIKRLRRSSNRKKRVSKPSAAPLQATDVPLIPKT